MSDRINDAKAIATDVFGEDDLIRRTDAVEALAEWGISPLVLMPVPSAEPKTADSGSLDSDMPEIKADRTTGDLIRRQDAIDALCQVDEYNSRSMSAIKHLPSAQRTGEWNICDDGYVRCSECNTKAPWITDEAQWMSDYCPNCGAKMKGENNETD